ncbi:MAG: dTMP kinase [Woeseia sp.]|mgnify:CR=1 FL=1|nr:dTMP kinase [Woeseia sp.]|tara:strand:- start:922 stop:1548 length:627 start_codon:yes stop_codon:yes gene_type:complete
MNRGRFITIEGIEGTGKSTNVEFLKSLVKEHEVEVITTREPGGTPLAEQIRELLLVHREENLPPLTELLLFFASRSVMLKNLVIPALERGDWVICDRFTDATRAYQGAGRGLDISVIEQLADWVHGGLQPDLTVLLDAPAELGISRVKSRGQGDRMDSQELIFYEKVRTAYLNLAKENSERFVVVDATESLVDVQNSIREAVVPLFAL